MSESTPPRPPQVTLAAGVLMAGSALVVWLAFDTVAGLHTLHTREAVERMIADAPAGLGVDVDRMLSLMRVLAMVAAGCATAVAVLGYQVLRRSRSARVAISVLAAPLFVAGLVTGGFVSSLVAASAVMLWLQPARNWFAGLPAPERPARPARPAPAPRAAAPPPGVAPTPPRDQLPPGVWPAPYAAGVDARPPAVLWACILTWVGCGLAVLSLVAGALMLAVDPDVLVDEARKQNPELAEQGVTDGMLVAVTMVLLAGLLAWCVAAVVLAVLVLRRVAWARIVLIVSASVSAALCLGGTALGQFVLLVPLLASIVAVALLARPDVRPWFDRTPTH